MAGPSVPIEVDPATGAWSTDGLPMVYVPVHFFTDNHRAVADEIGVERHAAILYRSGHASARHWCEHEQARHGLTGDQVFRHYIDRISRRGWGRFTVEDLHVDEGRATVLAQHTVFTDGHRAGTGDYLFTGWFAGAMDWVLHAAGSSLRATAELVPRQGSGGQELSSFEVRPGDPQ